MTAGRGEYRRCPRCKRPTNGWLLARGDACSPDHYMLCIREPKPEWPAVPLRELSPSVARAVRRDRRQAVPA